MGNAEGETFVMTTFSAILQDIAAVALEKRTVHLNTKVTSVQTKSEDVEGSKVILKTEKGESFEFDEVVMTTPLGWLKRNKDVFTPALPSRLSQAIDNISVGRLEKVRSPSPHTKLISTQPHIIKTGLHNLPNRLLALLKPRPFIPRLHKLALPHLLNNHQPVQMAHRSMEPRLLRTTK